MPLENLFVYGTLMEENERKRVLGRNNIELHADSLENYGVMEKAVKIEKEYYPTIFSTQNSFVEGFVLKVSSEEIRLLDEHETNAYKREKVFLKSGKEAWVYIKN